MFDKVYLGTIPISKIYLGDAPIEYNSTKIPVNAFAIYTVSSTSILPTVEECAYYNIHRYNNDGTYTVILVSLDSSRPSKIKFSYMQNLLSVEYIDSSNMESMSYMFSSCDNLKEVKGISRNNGKVIETYRMFTSCNALRQIDLSTLDTRNANNMKNMFYDCRSLEYLDIRNFYVHSTNSGLRGIIEANSALKTIRMDNCDVETITNLINGRVQIVEANPSVTVYCNKSNATYSLPTGWSYKYTLPPYVEGQFSYDSLITKAEVTVDQTHTSLMNMFYACSSLTYVDTSTWDTSNVTNMSYMFYCCESLESLDLSTLDTSKVTDMSSMFSSSILSELDIRNFDLTNVSQYNTYYMLQVGNKLHTLRLDNCNKDTIEKIITSTGFPTSEHYDGLTRKIYVRRENAEELTAPMNWIFVYVD